MSKNVFEIDEDMQLSFPNVILSEHEEPVLTETLSRALWGSYLYNYPVPAAGRPPAVLFTFERTVHWQLATEERLRVRAEDLCPRPGLFTSGSPLLAVKTSASNKICLIPANRFLPAVEQLPMCRNAI